MSAPQAFRLAIEACRPIRSSTFRLRPLLHTRPFSHERSLRARKETKTPDITAGFPMPEAEAYEQQHDVPEAPVGTEAIPELKPEPERAAETIEASQTMPDPAPPAEMPAPTESTTSQTAAADATTASPTRTSTDTISELTTSSEPPLPERIDQPTSQMFPPNVLAAYLAPMRHQPIHGIPVGSLQLRSYSLRNLEFFADFCMRAAFYLKMPARGPVPLPRQIERWTTLKSNFVNKKAQENFERITYKRLITVLDAEKSAVEVWLAFVRKWQFYGVGMKANVWSYEGVDVAKTMDKEYDTEISKELDIRLGQYGWNKEIGEKSSMERLLLRSDKTRNYVGTPMSNVRESSLSGNMKEKNLGIEVS